MDRSLQELKERVKAGNEKLIAAWLRIWDIRDEEKRQQEMKRWDKANLLLDVLCMELMYRFNFRDCLYLDGNGHKTRPCVRQDGFCCFVCPSETPHWRRKDEVRQPTAAPAQMSMDRFWGEL